MSSDPIRVNRAARLVGVAVFVLGGMLAAGGHAQFCELYTEDFSSFLGPADFDNGTFRVEWCEDGASVTSSNFCPSGNSFRMDSQFEDPLIWVFTGGAGCTQVRLEFDYSQFSSTATQLEFSVTNDAAVNCSELVSGFAASLSATGGVCTPVSHTVTLSSGQSVYWQFEHGTPSTNAIFIDNVRVSLAGCDCAGGTTCGTDYAADFGSIFQSGSVCSLFPDLFESCEGSGPFITSGTDCGGVGDMAMSFSSGFPFSAAVARCIDLTAASAAVIDFSYSKVSGTLGPRIEASVSGGPFSTIWTAPFTVGSGCLVGCADLSAFLGQPELQLKFSAGTSLSNSHAFDDIALVLDGDVGSGVVTDLGCALAGVFGNPLLDLTGSLADGSVGALDLTGAATSAAVGLFISLSSTPTPFKGGTLKPVPFLIPPVVLVTDGLGQLLIPFFWPCDIPAGLEIFLQYVIQDAAGPAGFALSNALRVDTA